MTELQAIFLAMVQGLTELLPISSLGHAVILPALLGWSINQQTAAFLPFLVMLHVGTAVALLSYFWRDWYDITLALLGLGQVDRIASLRRLLVLILVATVPAAAIGLVLNHALSLLFSNAPVAAAFLVVNGIVLLVVERIRRKDSPRPATGRSLDTLTVADALVIGLWQCTALIPGISRSGVTIAGGLMRRLDHEAAAHFSFLMATPVIIGAAVLEVPKLLRQGSALPGFFGMAVQAGVVAGVVAWVSTWALMRYFKKREVDALNPFAYYCIALGLFALWFLQ